MLSAFATIQRENTDRSIVELRKATFPELYDTATPALPVTYDLTYLGTEWTDTPAGAIRIVAGWKVGYNTIQTEDGNTWGLNTEEIEDSDLLLVWLDDMGTSQIEDDRIMKVWKAVYN